MHGFSQSSMVSHKYIGKVYVIQELNFKFAPLFHYRRMLLTTTLYVLEVITEREELTEELKDLKKFVNNTNIYLTDVRKTTKDTAEDTKKIKELIENLTENVSNAEKVNAQRYAQMKEHFTQLMKGNLANPEVPTHSKLYSICFIFNP